VVNKTAVDISFTFDVIRMSFIPRQITAHIRVMNHFKGELVICAELEESHTFQFFVFLSYWTCG
jgi:hypothetical protein